MEWTDVIYVEWFYFENEWSEVSYCEVLGNKNILYIRITLYLGYLIVLWLFHLVCILYCGCFNLFCNVWVCVCVGVGMWGCVYGWVCVCVGFVMCGCFGNMCTCIYCVLYCLYCVSCIVSFMYIYSYLFGCTGVRTTATDWQLNGSSNNNNNNNNNDCSPFVSPQAWRYLLHYSSSYWAG